MESTLVLRKLARQNGVLPFRAVLMKETTQIVPVMMVSMYQIPCAVFLGVVANEDRDTKT